MEDKQVQTEGDLISNLTTGSILILDIQVTMVVIILALYIQDLLPISCSYDLYFVLIHTPISKCSSHVFIYINVKWVFFFFLAKDESLNSIYVRISSGPQTKLCCHQRTTPYDQRETAIVGFYDWKFK